MCYSNSSTSQLQALKEKYRREFSQPELYHPVFFASGFTFPQWPIVSKSEKIELMQWGLLPHWLKTDPKQFATNTLNAKSETLAEKASFKHLLSSKRCIVPSTGFYEYQTTGKEKTPYFIYSKEEPLFSMAGLYDTWYNAQNGQIISSFTIITCEANALLSEIHNTQKRMPVILPGDLAESWVRTGDLNLLKPLRENFLSAHIIDKKYINTNDPRVQEHFTPPPTLIQGSLF